MMKRFRLGDDPLPLYHQLQHHLSERIRTGEFSVGDALPTEEQLCAAYGVSRITVRRALEALLHAGRISRRRGVGTFVAEPPTSVKSLTLLGSLSELFVNAKDLSYRVLSRGPAEPDRWVRQALEAPTGGQVHRLEVINLSGLLPFAYSEFFFDDQVGARISDADLERSVPILALAEDKAGARVARAVQTIEPALADGVEAEHLRIAPGVAVLRVLRTYFTGTDRPVQAQIMRCHPVHYRYTVTLFGGGDEATRAAPGAADAHYVQRPPDPTWTPTGDPRP
jgi:GntR family transcriptional regulator